MADEVERVLYEVADLNESVAGYPFAVLAIYPDRRAPEGDGCVATVVSLHRSRPEAEEASQTEAGCCPRCQGDCGSANPPVMHCPMRAHLKDQPQ